jgi:hypothetical protein
VIRGTGVKIKRAMDSLGRKLQTSKPSIALRPQCLIFCFSCTLCLFANFTECKRQIVDDGVVERIRLLRSTADNTSTVGAIYVRF